MNGLAQVENDAPQNDSSQSKQLNSDSSSEEKNRGPNNGQQIFNPSTADQSQIVAPAGNIGSVQGNTTTTTITNHMKFYFNGVERLGGELSGSPLYREVVPPSPLPSPVVPPPPSNVLLEESLAPTDIVPSAQLPPPPVPPTPRTSRETGQVPSSEQHRSSDQTPEQNLEPRDASSIESPHRGWFHDSRQYYKDLPRNFRSFAPLFIITILICAVVIGALFGAHILPLDSKASNLGTATLGSVATTPGSSHWHSSIPATPMIDPSSSTSTYPDSSTLAGVTAALSTSSEPTTKTWTTSYTPSASSPLSSICSWGCYGWDCTLPSTPCNSLWQCISGYCMPSTSATTPSPPTIAPAPAPNVTRSRLRKVIAG